jgi:nucleotide-binding universal stress UspA family protein
VIEQRDRLGPRRPPRATPVDRRFRILLAGGGGPFAPEVLDEAVRLAEERHAKVAVLQLLRVWGTGLGLPHPGLRPNRQEQQAAIDTLDEALAHLAAHDIPVAEQLIIGTRHPAQAILRHIQRTGTGLVVMGAPAKRRMGDWNWGNEPYRVAKKAPVEVVLVTPQAKV